MKVNIESRQAGFVKALIFFVAAALVYALVFSNEQLVIDLLSRKDYFAPAFAMGVTVLVAWLYGTAVSKFMKHTLEKALQSQCMREE